MRLRRQDIETLLAPHYIDGLDEAEVGEVRRRRDECQRAEVVVSYLRRLIQGELDLVIAEIDLRATGARGDVHRLVEDLPAILGSSPSVSVSRSPAEVTVRFGAPTSPEPDRLWPNEDALLDDLIGEALSGDLVAATVPGGALPGANIGSFADEELAELVERLRDDEATLSLQRRQLHERIDLLQAAIVVRYKTGAANADALLLPDRIGPASPEGGADAGPDA